MDTTPVALFLDCNILLHFKHVQEIDWTSLVGSSSVELYLSRQTIRELDHAKVHNRISAIRDRASQFALWLRSNRPPVRLKDDVILKFSPLPGDLESHNLSASLGDDIFLGQVLAFKDSFEGSVSIVSDDSGLILRAPGYDVDIIELPDECRVKLPVDESDNEIRQLKRELATFKSRQPKFALAPADDAPPISLEARHFGAMEEFVHEKVEAEKVQVRRLDWGISPDRKPLGPDTLRTYNRKVDSYISEDLPNYLQGIWKMAVATAKIFPIELVLKNDGTLPGTELTLTLVASAPEVSFMSAEDFMETFAMPRPPDRPSLNGGHNRSADTPPLPRIRSIFEQLEGSFEVKQSEVLIKRKSLGHHETHPLDKFYVVLSPEFCSGGFSLHWELRCNELVDVKSGALGVQVTL